MLDPHLDLSREQTRARSLGCLLGGAVGDSLGSPVEFLPLAQIRQQFGPQGIQNIAPSWGKPAAITDDTQMTLFTAEGLLRAYVRGSLRGICHVPSVVANAYGRWLRTQGEAAPILVGEEGWLVRVHELHARRAPGNTCLAALRSLKSLGDGAANNSKGCGGVMRAAPVGIFAFRNGTPSVFKLGCDTARTTHGHPGGYLPAGCLAVIVAELMQGVPLASAIDTACELLRQQPQHEETLALIESARELAAAGIPGPEHLTGKLGEGWVGESALAIAIACALAAHDFDEGIRAAVNHDGDSDSTGAITGNILGARWGVAAIDYDRWLANLELREVITTLACDLAQYRDWNTSDPQLQRLYPGN